MYTACVLIGIFINGGIPLFFEIACEASYPVAEGVTGGLLTLLNNIVGICFLCVLLIPNIGILHSLNIHESMLIYNMNIYTSSHKNKIVFIFNSC
jgi:hypothetical protein